MSQEYNVINPYDNSLVGSFIYASREETQAALDTLRKGKAVLAGITAHERSLILHRLGDLLEEAGEEIATLITQETGKTWKDSRIELQRSANTTRCSGDEARQIHGEVLDSDAYPPARGKWGIVQRRPLGIVLAITPFNFPINIAMHKIGPAFAAGCPVFFKPSPINYFSSKRLAELCHEAGIPEEALQFCVPDIPELSEVIRDPDVQAISFTGGNVAAEAIARNAGGKKLLFELGGNDPLIVMPDGDVDAASTTAIQQRFGTAGQRCTAAKRIFVHAEVYDNFKALLLEKTAALVVGDPMNPDTFVGPVIHAGAAAEIEERIQGAIAEGATLLAGGQREGNIVHPTVMENVPPTCELCFHETFGPVMPLFQFTDVEEVVTLVNATGFGLQAGVYTQNLATIKHLYNSLEVGALAVNDGPGFRAEHFPFGGIKKSGLGREGIRYAIEEFSYMKTLIL